MALFPPQLGPGAASPESEVCRCALIPPADPNRYACEFMLSVFDAAEPDRRKWAPAHRQLFFARPSQKQARTFELPAHWRQRAD